MKSCWVGSQSWTAGALGGRCHMCLPRTFPPLIALLNFKEPQLFLFFQNPMGGFTSTHTLVHTYSRTPAPPAPYVMANVEAVVAILWSMIQWNACFSVVEQGQVGSRREGWASAALQDVPTPGFASARQPLDETVRVFPQTQANQQCPGPAWTCECPTLNLTFVQQ